MKTGSLEHFPMRVGWLFPLICVVALWVLPSASRADPVTVRAGTHSNFGRIVFDWPEPTGFETRVSEQQLVVRFDRPFEGDTGPAQRVLGDYVSAIRAGADGMSVILTLTRPFDVQSRHYDTSVVIDLVAGAGSEALLGPGVRIGEHPDFTRTVFDWYENVSYEVEKTGNRVAISFGRTGAPDLSRFSEDPPRYIEGAAARAGDQTLRVTLDVAEGTDFRHFRDGNRIVVDIIRGSARDTARPPRSAARRAEPPGQETGPDKTAPAAPGTRPAVAAKPVPDLGLPANAARLKPTLTSLPNGVRLVFPWDNPTPAAIFQRADYLWAVFDRPAKVDFGNLSPEFSDRLITAEQLPNRHATILRFKIPADRFVSVTRSELDWVVDLTATPILPAYPLTAERELDVHGGARIFVPVVDTGGRWDLRDPEVGDVLAVVPVLAPGHGMPEERMFAEFHILPSAQGVVIQPLSERVNVEPRRNGVRIVAEEGLILSTGRLPERLSTVSGGASFPDPSEELVDATGQIINYASWSRGGKARYQPALRELFLELARAPSGSRNTVRWNLVRFFFAHDRAAEGIGIMEVVAGEDLSAFQLPEYRLLRGAMRLMLRRLDEAAEDLLDRSLEADPHAALWRTSLAVARKDWDEAKRQYATGASVLKYYPPHHKARFRLDAALAASMTNDITMLRVELAGIENRNLGDKLRTRAALYRARLLEMEDDPAAADEQYALVMKAGYLPTAVAAEFARVKLLARSGKLDAEGQIKALESLRYKWRGGALELDVLHSLGRKYIESGDPANGLQILRRAITFFPNSVLAPGIAHEMNTAFRALFLEGAADEMSEVSSLALYYEFRELTPTGSDGDDMIRKLSERLVSVDLLNQASELLDHQVKFRLRGAEKARVGARLAIIHLLDRQPRDALTAIRMSRYPRIDASLKTERSHLEARALAEMERRGEALRLLEGDTSNAAEQIRADIHWGGKDWARAATRLERVLGGSLADNELLPSERFQVMRLAVALSLAGDRTGLDRIRRRFGAAMAATRDRAPFDILTSATVRTGIEFRDLAAKIASVSTLETFMSNYRDKTEDEAENAVN